MPLDITQMHRFDLALKHFPKDSVTKAANIMRRGALEAKKNLAQDAKKSVHFGQIGRSISYDTKVRPFGLEIELGPDKDRSYGEAGQPGPLANVAYFGGANGGGGSLDFDDPVEREFDQIDKFLASLGDDL